MTYDNGQCNCGVLIIQKLVTLDKIIKTNDGASCEYHENALK